MPFSSTPTYAELKAEVQSWLDRDDDATVQRVPSFIRYAHDEVVRGLRLPLVRKVAVSDLSAERDTLPADFQAIRSLTITGHRPMMATSEALRAAHAAFWIAGRPTEYSIENGSIAVAPAPGGIYPVTLVYDAVPLLMSADSDTNPVFAKTPFLYLCGALAAGFLFNQDQANAVLWETKFRQTLADVQRQGLSDAYSGPLQITPSTGFTP